MYLKTKVTIIEYQIKKFLKVDVSLHILWDCLLVCEMDIPYGAKDCLTKQLFWRRDTALVKLTGTKPAVDTVGNASKTRFKLQRTSGRDAIFITGPGETNAGLSFLVCGGEEDDGAPLPPSLAVWRAQGLAYQAYQDAPEQQQPHHPPISGWLNERHTSHGPIKAQPPGTQQQPGIQRVVVIVVHYLPITEEDEGHTGGGRARERERKKIKIRGKWRLHGTKPGLDGWRTDVCPCELIFFLKVRLTRRNIFSSKEAGLSTSVNAGGPVPMILQRA